MSLAISVGGLNAPLDPNDSKSKLIIDSAAITAAFACASLGLRFLSRRLLHLPWLLDDWIITVATPLALATSVINIYGATHDHYGEHFFVHGTLESLTRFLLGLWVFQITYTITIGLSKFAMIALYWRVFPAGGFRKILMGIAIINGCWLFSVTLVAILSCIPVQAFWVIGMPAQCIDKSAYFTGAASCNILIDIVLLVLPLFMIPKLKITRSQKIAVTAIFLIGVVVTIVSCFRLNELLLGLKVGLDTDPTFVLVGSGVMSVVEINLSIVCACLPSMRPLLRFILHGTYRDPSRSRSRRTPYGASSNSSKRRSTFKDMLPRLNFQKEPWSVTTASKLSSTPTPGYSANRLSANQSNLPDSGILVHNDIRVYYTDQNGREHPLPENWPLPYASQDDAVSPDSIEMRSYSPAQHMRGIPEFLESSRTSSDIEGPFPLQRHSDDDDSQKERETTFV